MLRSDLTATLSDWLRPEDYHDYAPNGLQVEGQDEIEKIVTGVTASRDLIEKAIDLGADTILVHHGWFWKREDPRITGIRKGRIQLLMEHDINLIAYHLPLDDNDEFGNNALWGQAMGFEPEGRFGEGNLGRTGFLPVPASAASLSLLASRVLKRSPLAVGDLQKDVTRVAWCSGAAQDMIEDAIAAGADCFLSGEISERTTHIAREAGIAYLSCGHHATERFGIRALGEKIAKELGLPVQFVDIDNPV